MCGGKGFFLGMYEEEIHDLAKTLFPFFNGGGGVGEVLRREYYQSHISAVVIWFSAPPFPRQWAKYCKDLGKTFNSLAINCQIL